MDFLNEASKEGIAISTEVRLAPLTTWKIGGAARFFFEASDKLQLTRLIKLARRAGVEFYVIGSGTNVLVADNGYEGLVIKIKASKISVSDQNLVAEAGAPMGKAATIAMQHNLSGLEWAIGIPGTVGGAVVGNSNCFGGATAQAVDKVEIITRAGEINRLSKKAMEFDYDYSSLQKTKDVIWSAEFKLKKVSSDEMTSRRLNVAKLAAERFGSQPLGLASAGSTFKALKTTPATIARLESRHIDWKKGLRDNLISAGFIIDKGLQMKGFRLGEMQISHKHANFLINTGNATAKNARELIDLVKKECKNKLGLTLEEEIQYLGDF